MAFSCSLTAIASRESTDFQVAVKPETDVIDLSAPHFYKSPKRGNVPFEWGRGGVRSTYLLFKNKTAQTQSWILKNKSSWHVWRAWANSDDGHFLSSNSQAMDIETFVIWPNTQHASMEICTPWHWFRRFHFHQTSLLMDSTHMYDVHAWNQWQIFDRMSGPTAIAELNRTIANSIDLFSCIDHNKAGVTKATLG